MRNRKYEAFTLVEMLIVMGILIILMVIGIAAGRFALNRANDVAHQNAADQLYQGLQAYYTDHRAFPDSTVCPEGGCTPAAMMDDNDILGQYMDMGSFNGGTAATFIYFVGGDNEDQAALVCVSMRGTKDINDERDDGAYYCSGNGFGLTGEEVMTSGTDSITVTTKTIEKGEDAWEQFETGDFTYSSDWETLTDGSMGWTELE
jgi:type II secretory pathway pseudopilin PulG